MNRRCLFVFAVVLFVVPLFAQNVTVTASVDSQTIIMGDWITYSVQVKHPASVVVGLPSYRDTLGAFDIVRQDSVVRSEQNGEVTLAKKFVITGFTAGDKTVPPFSVSYIGADGKPQSAESNPIPVRVLGIEVDTTQSIRDVKPQLSVPMSAEEIALYILIALALAGAGYGLYYYLRKRSGKTAEEEENVPDIPPHILAMIQLDELESRNVWKQGEYKLFYSEATEIVRRYFERRFRIMALEMTTGEVMSQLAACPVDIETIANIERFLRDADLVKFAKYQPAASENEGVIPAARSIVEKTKPAEPGEPQEKEAQHV